MIIISSGDWIITIAPFLKYFPITERKGSRFPPSLWPGGGRYDYLSELIGGRPICAVGAAVGWGAGGGADEKKRQARRRRTREVPESVFVHIGDLAKQKGFGVMESLRQAGIVVSESLGKDLLKAQMRLADKEGAAIALIFGQKEVLKTASSCVI